MKVGILFSGGKDSTLALYKAKENHKIICLISIISKNKESYMFHVPNIELTKIQAKAICLPFVQRTTKGEKEKELEDLKKVLVLAKKKFKIEGIVTGAVKSNYQKTRLEKICKEINLKCFNPLWMKDQIELLNELLENNFEVIISGVFSYPLDQTFLGKTIDKEMINKLKQLEQEYKINPSGEGGEIETTVLDAPFFKKKIKIQDSDIEYKNNSGIFKIKKLKLVEK
jgi:ABC transporter with metal-binding/Fe-S-binding domain ATP-binding protein